MMVQVLGRKVPVDTVVALFVLANDGTMLYRKKIAELSGVVDKSVLEMKFLTGLGLAKNTGTDRLQITEKGASFCAANRPLLAECVALRARRDSATSVFDLPRLMGLAIGGKNAVGHPTDTTKGD